jgi:hypothetical protein
MGAWTATLVGVDRETARQAPRAFLSHASEDKEHFVLEFAERLRASGVDVWLDRWEMRPGASLVRKIFTDGIDNADFFMVVVSQVSVGKPWVQEELDAGVVRKINGTCRLIPIVLDGAPVPPALAHLLYVDVKRLGLEGATEEVLRVVFGSSPKPPLGEPPSYAERQTRYVTDPIDDLVAEVLVDAFREGRMVRSDELRESPTLADVAPDQVDESVAALQERGLIEVSHYLGGNYTVTRIRPAFWLDAEARNGVDIGRATDAVLARLVNDGYLDPRRLDGIHELTARSIIELSEQRGLLTTSRSIGGPIRVASVSPTLRRRLRTDL